MFQKPNFYGCSDSNHPQDNANDPVQLQEDNPDNQAASLDTELLDAIKASTGNEDANSLVLPESRVGTLPVE